MVDNMKFMAVSTTSIVNSSKTVLNIPLLISPHLQLHLKLKITRSMMIVYLLMLSLTTYSQT